MTRTRTQWLAAAVERMRPWFAELGKPLPDALLLEASLAGAPPDALADSTGGLCSPPDASGAVRILIAPHIHSAMPRQGVPPYAGVLEVLLHECAHAAVGTRHGHGGPFARLEKRLGFEVARAGRRRLEWPTATLREQLARIEADLGPYPPPASAADLERAEVPR